MNDELILIPRYIINSLHPSGYFERVNDMVYASGMNYRQAFETLEEEREQYGIPAKYDNYESFRVSKTYYFRKLVRITF